MSVQSQIEDGAGSGHRARVTDYGQLVVAPVSYDQAKFVELATTNTAYNFYAPMAGKRFVITLIRAKADRNVSGTTDAVIIIYEAGAEDTTTVAKTLHQEAMVKGESVTLPLNLLVTEGVFVNAKTSDDDIHMSIFGYYVSVT